MYEADYRNKFKKDYKRCKKRGLDGEKIKGVMTLIMHGEKLPSSCHPHLLEGEYVDCWECHISPDWLLIWIVDDENMRIEFVRTGTHSDLFKK